MGPWAIGTLALAVFVVLLIAALVWHDKRRLDAWLAQLEADWDHPTDADLDREFAFTAWEASCRNLYTVDQLCRRPAGHRGQCASGFGLGRRRWAA